MKINILGQTYTLEKLPFAKDPFFAQCAGYCDKSSHRIVICIDDPNCDLDDREWQIKKVMRHEIVHAFLFESGIAENFEHKQYGHEETLVDWFAIQSPKIIKVFQTVGCM